MLKYGTCWNFTVEIPVLDIDAEVHFFRKAFLFSIHAQDDVYAMLTDDGNHFFISIRRHPVEVVRSASAHVKLCFMVTNLEDIEIHLQSLGISFATDSALAADSPFVVKWCMTPSGYRVDFWGESGER